MTATWPSEITGITRAGSINVDPLDLADVRGIARRIAETHPDEAALLERYVDGQRAQRPIEPPAMTAEEVEVLELVIANRRSEATQRVYKSAFERFRSWCESRMQTTEIMPVHSTTLILYLLDLFNNEYSQSSLNQVTAAVGHEHREHNLPDPSTDTRVRSFMSGVARARKEIAAKQAKPISSIEFETIEQSPATPTSIALIAVMRDAMLRAGEASRLEWSHITRDPDGSATLKIPFSKTDQTGQGDIRYLRRSTVALLYAFADHAELRPFPYHPDTIGRQISKACRLAGLGEGYSGHSPRVGMGIDLVRNGASLVELQREGRWKSPTMPAYYARNEEARRGAVARLMEKST